MNMRKRKKVELTHEFLQEKIPFDRDKTARAWVYWMYDKANKKHQRRQTNGKILQQPAGSCEIEFRQK